MSLEESVSTAPVESGPSEGLYSTEDIVAKLRETKPEEPAAEPEQNTVEGQPEQPEEPQDDAPDYPMPEGWEEAMWQGMAPDVRGKVDAVMKAHAEALGAKVQEMQTMQNQHRELIDKANADAVNLLNFLREVTYADYQNIDWQALEADPETYFPLRRAFESRMNTLQQLQEQWGARAKAAEEARIRAYNEGLQSEISIVRPKIQALVGAGYNDKTFPAEMAAYLEKAGVPKQAISMMSKGYELELATKAMLYDKLMGVKAKAATKVANAPVVQSPRGFSQEDGGDVKGQRLRALRNNPRDNDALAELLKVW